MDPFEILVIILSITLAIFLIIAIIVGVMMIKLLNRVNVVAARAESIVTNIDNLSDKMKQFAVPTAVMSMVAKAVKQYKYAQEEQSHGKKW